MKSAKEILESIRTELGMKSQEVSLAQMTLDNGTIIEAEEFAPEMDVFIVTEDQKVPLPSGEYTLEDGRVLVCEQDGIIMEIADVKSEEEEPVAEAPSEEQMSSEWVSKAEFEELKSVVNSLMETLSKEEPTEELSEEVQEEVQMSEQVELSEETQLEAELSEPAVESFKHTPEKTISKEVEVSFYKTGNSLEDELLSKFSKFN